MDIMIITISNNNPKALQGSKSVFILIAVAGAVIHLLLLFFCIFQMFCNKLCYLDHAKKYQMLNF